jgi:hypothetical protein
MFFILWGSETGGYHERQKSGNKKAGSIYQLISVMTFSPFHSIGTKHTTFCCYVDYRIANALEK